MTSRFQFTAILTIIAVLGCSLAAQPVHRHALATNPALKPLTTTNYPVTVRISGIAHLIGKKGDKTRLLVVPNLTAVNPRHAPLLLATPDYKPYGLGKKRTQTLPDSSTVTYYYTEMTAGLEIDLIKSGLASQGSLDFDESDKDQNGSPAECPDPQYAKRRSLYWLPRLSTASGVGFNVRSAYSKKDPSPTDVVTRIEIEDGTLDADPGADRFVFDVNGKKKHTQAVTKELRYTFLAALDSAAPVLTLYGRQFKKKPSDTNQYVEIARFEPYNGAIEIHLANVVEDDFFKPMAMATLPHFHLYYGAVSRFWGVPTANATRGNTCGGVGGSVECGPDQLP